MSVCLDAWAVLAWLDGDQPATGRVSATIRDRPIISWVNLVEVYYRIERRHGRDAADRIVGKLRSELAPDLPGTARMLAAARLKAANAIALGDCFALATAAAHGVRLFTGDPEIIGVRDPPCEVEDLRVA